MVTAGHARYHGGMKWNPSASQWFGLLVLGGVLGALCDQIHVRFGVLSYPRADVLLQAWWVAPNFALSAVVMLVGSQPFVEQGIPLERSGPSSRELAIAGLWFLAAYFASGLLQDRPALLMAGYVAAWLARVLPRAERKPMLVHGILLAAAGTGYETVLSAMDTFHYHHPQVLGVPVWLPGLYLHGSPLAFLITRALRPAR
jgi:hypothetical protein